MNRLSINDIKKEFKNLRDAGKYTISKSGSKTIEIINADFEVKPDETAIFGKLNEYVERELEWYKSMSLNVNDIPGECPKIWKMTGSPEGWINSNYGWCIFNPANGLQYAHCLQQLIEDPATRRACMIYNRPEMQTDWNLMGRNDFMCTFSTQQFIRDGKLVYIVLMRSNDAVFGFKNDLYWHRYVAHLLIDDLKKNGIVLDDEPIIYWHADSLHLYERHFNLIDE
jgi:thymidylate synthase